MSVRFILGRSGSGKTFYCLDKIRQELLRAPDGPPLMLLTPEQATFQMEQQLLSDGQLIGFNRVMALSFRRWAYKVLNETAKPPYRILTESGKQMLLHRLIQVNEDGLTIFKKSVGRIGFARGLSGMISELRHYRVEPDNLLRQRELLIERGHDSDLPLTDKLADLALIYRAYQQEIQDKFIDPDDILDLAGRQCGRAGFMQGLTLLVDGFAGFTPQQSHALMAMIDRCVEVEICLCLDPDGPEAMRITSQPGMGQELDPIGLFYPTLKTYLSLLQEVTKHRNENPTAFMLAEPLCLPDETAMPRYSNHVQLSNIEKKIFNSKCKNEKISIDGYYEKTSENAIKHEETHENAPKTIKKDLENDIEIIECFNPRREVEAVAGRILELCREEGYRFKETAVILRDFAGYEELLMAVFADHGIPYFLDQRRRVHHHPLVTLVRAVLEMVLTDYKTEHVVDYLKTDLSPLGRDEVDILENAALAYGINRQRWVQAESWPEHYQIDGASDNKAGAKLDELRRRALSPVETFVGAIYRGQKMSEERLPVSLITVELVRLLEGLDVSRSLKEWYRAGEASGKLDESRTHEQAFEHLLGVFEDMIMSLGDVSMRLSEYEDILTSILEQITLPLVPPYLDQVLIGTMERSRHPDIRAAFILGCNEHRFPRPAASDTFLTEQQREQLRGDGLELAPTRTELLYQEQYLAYIALTRPREYLWVSYSRSDGEGKALEPSPFLSDIRAAAPGVRHKILPSEAICSEPEVLTTPFHLIQNLARRFSVIHGTPAAGQGVESLEPLWRELYAYCLREPTYRELARTGLAGLAYRNDTVLESGLIERLQSKPLVLDTTRLETFAACPFKYYVRYFLGLRERKELRLESLEMGSFYHEVLCRVFEDMRRKGLNWGQVSDEQAGAFVSDAVAGVLADEQAYADICEAAGKNRFLLREAQRQLGRFCGNLNAMAAAGGFRQRYAELRFGVGEEWQPSTLRLGDGREALLQGRIDRVDFCQREDGVWGMAVLDYKSSSRAFGFGRFYHGLSLQLISYLVLLEEALASKGKGPVEPAGALYQPVVHRGQTHQGAVPENLDTGEVIDKPDGLLGRDWLGCFDRSVANSTSSSYYRFRLNKDGTVSKLNKNVITGEEMAGLIRHCREKIIELAERMTAGEIAVRPYRLGRKETACAWCEYQAVCRFDFNHDVYRHLAEMGREEVLEKLKKSRSQAHKTQKQEKEK